MSGEEINTFVIIDLETNGLPAEQFNKCSITEISLYAFSAKCLTDRDFNRQLFKNIIKDEADGFDPLPPELPRVLNKLSLMVNPRAMIHPTAEKTTGLNNEMLEYESPFDKNTAMCLNLFLERLEQPVCLVAHNGWKFDYPIIRHVYEKLKMSLPTSVYCVDSLNAFRELDEKSEEIEKNKKIFTLPEADESTYLKTKDVSNASANEPLEQNSKINWQLKNETTPQRNSGMSTSKNNDKKVINWPHTESIAKNRYVSLSVRRSLFADDFKPKSKYPPKGVYKLGQIYKRCFKQDPVNLHRAESDVAVLSKLVLHYGLDFLAYAEERKQPFTNVPKLGSSS